MAKRNANTPHFPFLDKLDIDQDVKSRLSINLANIYSGNDNVLITPIAKVKGPDVILSAGVYVRRLRLRSPPAGAQSPNRRTSS